LEKYKLFKSRFFDPVEDEQNSTLPDGVELSDEERKWLTDFCLCRYLRAREWDLDAAEKMLRETLQWKREYKPESITAEEIESESKTGKIYFANTFDKFERPIIYMKPRKDDSTDRVIKVKYLVYMMERAIEAMDEKGKGVEKCCIIVDFQGTGMRQSSVGNIQVSLDCAHVLQNHYPERLGLSYMLNTPWLFSAFWKCISPFLSEDTLKKKLYLWVVRRIMAC